MSVRIAAPPPAGGSGGRPFHANRGGRSWQAERTENWWSCPFSVFISHFFLIPRWVFGVLGKLRFVIITSLRSFLFLTSLRSSFILYLPYDFLNLFLFLF